MFRLLSVATVVALSATLAGTFGAAAQSADPPRQAQGESRADRLAEVKDALRLTPEQEPLWGPVADALRNLRETMARAEQGAPGDAMERLRRHADRSASRAEALKRLTDAAQPLWNALSEEQKRMLPRALRYAARVDDQERMSWRERDDRRGDRMMGRDGMMERERMMDRMHRDRMGDPEDGWRDRRDRMGGRDFGMNRHDRWWREESDDGRERSDDRRMGRRGDRDDRWESDPRDGYGRHGYDRRRFDDDRGWGPRIYEERDGRDRRGWGDEGRDRRGFGRDRFCD